MRSNHKTLPVQYWTGTHPGARDHNEDTIVVRPEYNLFVVADGAGGHNAGDVASSLATNSIVHYFDETAAESKDGKFDVLGIPFAAKRLSAAIHRANEELIALAQSSNRYQGMGTTIVAGYFSSDRVLHLAHVGDSRCYRFRDSQLESLTVDHSLATDVLELTPTLPEEKAKEFPANVVTRALGMSPKIRVASRSLAVYKGDRFLFCTDGLTNTLSEERIAALMTQPGEAATNALLKHTTDSTDNVAVVIVSTESWVAQTGRQLRAPHEERDSDYPEIVMTSDPSRLRKGAFSSSAARVFAVPDEPESGSFELRRKNTCNTCGAVFSGAVDMCPHCSLHPEEQER